MSDLPTGVRAFMVELFNKHEHREMVRSYCSVGRCRRKHEITEKGGRRHVVARLWVDDRWDVRRLDTGEVVATNVYSLYMCRVPGAMFFTRVSDRLADERKPGSSVFESGPQLEVVLPNGWPWNIDGRANNCTMQEDFDHRCWIRHGEPPVVTVDKQGKTCAAGAGSIQAGDYHGFLKDGVFNP